MRTTLLCACFVSIVGGTLFFAYQFEWLLIRLPQFHTNRSASIKIKKPIQISFWRDGKWYIEKQELLWSNDTADNLFYLVTNWLNTLDAEEVINEKITLEAASISPNGTDAYLSFDRNPFPNEWSTYKKWMWIEGLLKTIAQQQLPIQQIYLLVHHKPLADKHIDTSNPWPISGFIALNENQLQ